jgi:hypothetical protein
VEDEEERDEAVRCRARALAFRCHLPPEGHAESEEGCRRAGPWLPKTGCLRRRRSFSAASAVLVALLPPGGVMVLESAQNIGETYMLGHPERELPVALPPPWNPCVATPEEELALTCTVGAKVGARRPESVCGPAALGRRPLLTVKIRQPSHEFTFGVGISFIPYPLVLTPVV